MSHSDELSEDSDMPGLSEISDGSDVSDVEESVNKNDIDDVIETNNPDKIKVTIKIQSIEETYKSYLQDTGLLLNPDYQRGVCWKLVKMNAFIDTIMKNYIVPGFVIHKLSDAELDAGDHFYECIDGQNRMVALQYYIESKSINGKYIYWKNNNERVYYNMESQELNRLNKRKPSRNLTKQEKLAFNNFNFCFHIIETVNPDNKISFEAKCDIFNRLQNGTPVIAWIKVRNMNNIITMSICKNKLLDKMNELNFIDRMYLKSIPKEAETFNIFFLIRAFLIIDKKNLDINYVDSNIKKYLEENDYKGTQAVQISSDIDSIVPHIIKMIEFISNRKMDILPELAYIYICFYANNNLGKLRRLFEYFKNNDKLFQKYNNYKTYRKTLAGTTPTEKMIQIYNEISNININASNNNNTNNIA
jgi:hypothetical protein